MNSRSSVCQRAGELIESAVMSAPSDESSARLLLLADILQLQTPINVQSVTDKIREYIRVSEERMFACMRMEMEREVEEKQGAIHQYCPNIAG